MRKILPIVVTVLMFFEVQSNAQYKVPEVKSQPIKPFEDVEYKVEFQGALSNDKTPLWLNANRYGLSSLDKTNGYLRGAIERPISVDAEKKWGLGYGLDVAVPLHYTSKVVIQQAYVEGRWLHGVLSVGSKQYPMALKNDSLSSGSQTLGINARPVPQVRLALGDYWAIPLTKGWLHLKGHIAYGRMTDDNWQHDFTHKQSKYADGLLYHSKAGYLKIGNEERFFPLSVELGLEMVSIFGGTTYIPGEDGNVTTIKSKKGLKSFWNAFWPGGSDAGETTYQNAEGNQFGSWVARINYDTEWWTLSAYADKYFEDHSSMLQLDYDGYGSGDEWEKKKDKKFLVYDFKDWMLGLEYNYKPDNWLNTIVAEFLYTKYQSGPIYHDHTKTIPDHIGGVDDFYNHGISLGNQHWGQVMGNPLYLSPIYNSDGEIYIKDNRFIAVHLGLAGHPSERFNYRILGTWQEGIGTYKIPYLNKHHNVSFLTEGSYHISSRSKWLDNTSITAGYGMDFGAILGGINYGFQLTITKRGILGK